MIADDLEIVRAARKWVGTPYRHQASQLGAGCDCLGLIRGVWQELFGDEPTKIPPYSRSGRDPKHADQLLAAARHFLIEAGREKLPGRVALFRLRINLAPRHCGILIPGGRFIHSQERLGVIVTELDTNWCRRIHSLFSFPERSL